MNQEELLRAQYKVLGHEGLGLTEIRSVPTKYRSFNGNVESVVKNVQIKSDHVVDHYVGINPRKEEGKSHNEDIGYLTCIVFDIDPIRPTGTASTEEQHQAAISHGRTISMDLPNSILVDSGSGCHIYFPIVPIKITDHAQISRHVGTFIDAIRQKFPHPLLNIDHIQDPARLIRIWGSFNNKSKRICQPIGIEGIKEFPRFELNIEQLTPVSSTSNIKVPVTLADERFQQLTKLHPGVGKMMRGEGDFESRSEADFAFVAFLTKAQFAIEDIKHFARLNPLGRGEELDNKDIERIVAKIRHDGVSTVSLFNDNKSYMDNLEDRHRGLSTGFKRLDQMISGLQKGQIYVLAARTNQGKTSFACNIAYNLVSQGLPVLFFPTELGYEPLFDKIMAQATDINLRQFQNGEFTVEEKQKVQSKIKDISKFPFIVKEDYALTLAKVEQSIKEIAPAFVIVDYVQSMFYPEGGTSREIEANMRGLNAFAKQHSVPILVCSQFSRAALNSEVSLQHLKGSGAIEEAADVVLAISTLTPYDYPKEVDLHILKAKYGEVGKDRMLFYSSVGKFIEKEIK